MKKIGIITIVKANNYGAELQAFALQKKIEQLGFEAEIIDYLYYKNWRFKDSKLSRPFIPMNNKQKFLYWIKYRLINFIIDKILPIFNIQTKNRNKNFLRFHALNTQFSKKYSSMASLYDSPPQYDVYVVGSDQVWNPSAFSSIEPYFLTFVPRKAKKIAYASSFGMESIPNALQKKISNLLNNIDVISVREISGVNLVKKLIGNNIELVVDPTLLLTKKEWEEYMIPYSPTIAGEYILIYQLFDSLAITNLALKISKEKNLPIYRICKRSFGVSKTSGIENILDAGPSEFLYLMAHASILLTNSFHGTAFALNFNIPFYTIVSSKKKNNSRMESLLQMVGMSNRLFRDDVDIHMNNNINFNNANLELENIRQKSITFLSKNLF